MEQVTKLVSDIFEPVLPVKRKIVMKAYVSVWDKARSWVRTPIKDPIEFAVSGNNRLDQRLIRIEPEELDNENFRNY